MKSKNTFYGEYALLAALLLNSLGVELQVKSGFGVSCISSVSYALSRVFPALSFGTWNYLIQLMVLIVLAVCTKAWKRKYLVSVVLSVAFGRLLDLYAALLPTPEGLAARLSCYCGGFFIVCFSIWMLQRCLMPILPFDEFAKGMSDYYHVEFKRFKTSFDLSCLLLTVAICIIGLGHLTGIGMGTLASALFTGTLVSVIGAYMDRRWSFKLHPHPAPSLKSI